MDFTGTFKPVNTGTILIYQGANFRKQFVWTIKDVDTDDRVPVNLTGAEISAQVRRRYSSPILADLTPHIIITNAVGGTFEISMSAMDTESLNFDQGVFQLEVKFPDDVVVRLLEGFVELSREVVH